MTAAIGGIEVTEEECIGCDVARLLYGFGLRGIVPSHSGHDTCAPIVW